ncbi:helix-turn-helix domain-containing protein [Streptomyces fractus]|uniref:helix-turn-helix domain-containing protein n=1 Tax=Streptomyces fractus TaxID=641806 RepID=UPI003CF6BDBD
MVQQTRPNRRLLGAEIVRLRKAAGLRAADVATHLKCSETRVSRLENGNGRVKLHDRELDQLVKLFGIENQAQIQALRDLASDAAQDSAWWDGYREAMPSDLEPLLAFETDAIAEQAWESTLVHGLLQTREYARAIVAAWPSNRPVDYDDMVDVRMKRAELLTAHETSGRSTALEAWAILDESVLRRPVGSADVMRAQIEHLIELTELPNVRIQIMPEDKGAHPGLGGPFSILDFEEATPVVYIDSPAGNLYLDKKYDVRKFTTSFDLLRAMALDPDDSAARLRDAVKEKR